MFTIYIFTLIWFFSLVKEKMHELENSLTFSSYVFENKRFSLRQKSATAKTHFNGNVRLRSSWFLFAAQNFSWFYSELLFLSQYITNSQSVRFYKLYAKFYYIFYVRILQITTIEKCKYIYEMVIYVKWMNLPIIIIIIISETFDTIYKKWMKPSIACICACSPDSIELILFEVQNTLGNATIMKFKKSFFLLYFSFLNFI